MRLCLLFPLLAGPISSWASPHRLESTQRQAISSTLPSSSTPACANPTVTAIDFSGNPIPPFPIHPSCNSTLHRQLSRALSETVVLAEHARDHILQWGRSSPFVQKYFGNGTTATVLGWYNRVISADRGTMTFRCDDPDRNCATQEGELLFATSIFLPEPRDTISRS